MDSFKRPEMILSLANTAGIVGMGTYFYKQNAAIQSEIGLLSHHLATLIKEVAILRSLPNQVTDLATTSGELKTRFERLKSVVESLPEAQETEMIMYEIDSILTTLKDNGMEVERPEPPRRPSPPRNRRNLRTPRRPARNRNDDRYCRYDRPERSERNERSERSERGERNDYEDEDDDGDEGDALAQINAVRRHQRRS